MLNKIKSGENSPDGVADSDNRQPEGGRLESSTDQNGHISKLGNGGRLHIRRFGGGRVGLTLIEVMIALTMTLIILGAMMTAFQSVSRKMQAGRAVIELANRVRSVESLLRTDLANLTVETRPYLTTVPPGYFELIEGPRRDSTAFSQNVSNSVMGDVDDALAMTVRSDQMFRGRVENPAAGTKAVIESPLAEVIWFPMWDDETAVIPNFEETVTLRRRALLILPVGIDPNLRVDVPWVEVVNFFQTNDISARIVATGPDLYSIVANQLEDLGVRANRFAHLPLRATGTFNLIGPGLLEPEIDNSDPIDQNGGFPNQMHYALLRQFTSPDDIVLTDVGAFDLKVYSPSAVAQQLLLNPTDPTTQILIEPSDFGAGTGAVYGNVGGFVDLGHTAGGDSFDGLPSLFSGMRQDPCSYPGGAGFAVGAVGAPPAFRSVYDTWTPVYESDGINQDFGRDPMPPVPPWRDLYVDTFTDGLDNDGVNGVDDLGERETMPPYMQPLRGIQITLRAVEKQTKQVYQTTVVSSFVPE